MLYHLGAMHRTTIVALAALCAVTLTACSGDPGTMLSPSGVAPGTSALNPDGSNLKATAPTGLSPTGGAVLNTVRPTLTFTAATALHQGAALDHELQIVNANDQVVYSSQSASSPHGVPTDLSYADNFWWRVRARQGGAFGPWSAYAQFRTPDPPVATAPPQGASGSLPFPVPAECGPFGPDNRFACASAVASQSVEWQRCRAGDGLGCHRFTRQVGYALAQFDPAWTLIMAAPGGHACSCTGCGGSDGSMFREDTVVHNGNRVFDMILGAGGPSPTLAWSAVPGPRPGDLPVLPALCP
jgi:hypothetical protein